MCAADIAPGWGKSGSWCRLHCCGLRYGNRRVPYCDNARAAGIARDHIPVRQFSEIVKKKSIARDQALR